MLFISFFYMNKLKKIISSFLMLLLISSQTLVQVSAADTLNETVSKLDYQSIRLEEMKDGARYKEMIDAVYSQHSDKQWVIQLIHDRLETVLQSPKADKWNVRIVLEYMALQNNYAVQKHEHDVDLIAIYPINSFAADELVTLYSLQKEEILALSSSEKEEVQENILVFQENIYEMLDDMLALLIQEFKKQTQYVESGNINMKANINLEPSGSFEGNLDISDYEYRVNTFNSEFKALVEWMSRFSSMWWENLNISFEGLVDLIQKDGNMYLLLENLKIEWFQDSIIQNSAEEMLKNINDQWKFIRLDNAGSEELVLMLERLNPSLAMNNLRLMASTPMFTALGKKDDRYVLVPSKAACDIMKELANKFDPFNWDTCSESQYEKMIKDFRSEDIEIYLKTGETNELGMVMVDNFETFALKTSYDDENFYSFEFWVDAGDEWALELAYMRNSSLNFELNDKESSSLISFRSILDANNKMESYKLDANIMGNSWKFTANSSLQNNQLKWAFVFDMNEYDLTTNTYKHTNRLIGAMNGRTKTDNSIDTLNMKFTGNDIVKNTQPMTALIQYESGELSMDFDYKNEHSKIDGNFRCEWNESTSSFEWAELSFEVWGKQRSFDPLTYDVIYIWDLMKQFETNISLASGNIDGKTNIFSSGTKIVGMKHSWSYQEGAFTSRNAFELSSVPIPWVLPPVWTNNTVWEDVASKINGNINFSYQHTDLSQALEFFVNVLYGNTSIIDIQIQADSEREYIDTHIEAPDDFVDIEELYPQEEAEDADYIG